MSLDELADGERALVLVGDEPVEVLKSAGDIVARSLLCTHMGLSGEVVARARRVPVPVSPRAL